MTEEKNILAETKKPLLKGFLKDVIDIALLVIFVLLPIRLFIAQPFVVVGTSMYPTFYNGDYLIIDEISYRFNGPQRGDVIVFRPPPAPKDHYIKRVIGLPGETVKVDGNTVTIINKENPNGFVLKEQYVSSERNGTNTTVLGPNQYFVMGDNREASSDSRVWGSLNRDEITGRVLTRLFPIPEVGIWPGKASFEK
ncbi:MAG: signal peptidase I [Candidatus Paceibacterota bacterium]